MQTYHKLNKKAYGIFFQIPQVCVYFFTYYFPLLYNEGKKYAKNDKDIKNSTLFQGVIQSEEVFFSGDKYVSESKLELQIKKQLFPGYAYFFHLVHYSMNSLHLAFKCYLTAGLKVFIFLLYTFIIHEIFNILCNI